MGAAISVMAVKVCIGTFKQWQFGLMFSQSLTSTPWTTHAIDHEIFHGLERGLEQALRDDCSSREMVHMKDGLLWLRNLDEAGSAEEIGETERGKKWIDRGPCYARIKGHIIIQP